MTTVLQTSEECWTLTQNQSWFGRGRSFHVQEEDRRFPRGSAWGAVNSRQVGCITSTTSSPSPAALEREMCCAGGWSHAGRSQQDEMRAMLFGCRAGCKAADGQRGHTVDLPGLQSVRREQMERRTLEIVNAGLQLSFKMSRQMTPWLLILQW